VGTKLGTVKKAADLRSIPNYWCERGDSNPHGFPRQILSLVRLPIPPLSHELECNAQIDSGHHKSRCEAVPFATLQA
jgi:hypothetical protein